MPRNNNFPHFAPGTSAEERLDAGRATLRHALPLLWPVTLRFRYVPTEALPTTAVDLNGNLFYNPKFIEGAVVEGGPPGLKVSNALDTAYLLAHEACHILLRHLERRREVWKDPHLRNVANIAADAALNQLLGETAMRSSDIMQGTIQHLDNQFKGALKKAMKSHEHFEGIYEELLKALPPNSGGGVAICCIREEHTGQQGQQAKDANGNPIELPVGAGGPDDAPNWNDLAKEGATLQKQKGNQHGRLMGELLEALDDSKVPWHVLLGPQLSECVDVERYTWSRLSRRPSPDPEIVLPGVEKRQGCVAAGIDTSGSMSPTEIQIALTELSAICRQLEVDLYVMLHNVAPYFGKLCKEPSDLVGLPYSAGGTSHQPLFKVIKAALDGTTEVPTEHTESTGGPQHFDPLPENLQAVVCFTDMCSDFPPEFELPTVWINTTGQLSGSAPFGIELAYVK